MSTKYNERGNLIVESKNFVGECKWLESPVSGMNRVEIYFKAKAGSELMVQRITYSDELLEDTQISIMDVICQDIETAGNRLMAGVK